MKALTEERVNNYLYIYQVCQYDEIDKLNFNDIFEKDYPCNIYLIVRKPRITIDPDYLKFENNTVELKFREHNGYNFKEHIVKYTFDFELGKNVSIKSEFPNRYFDIIDENGIALTAKSTYILELCIDQIKDSSFMDYEVVYVGQSKDNEVIAPVVYRLKKHSTLQEIYNNIIDENIDKEIFFFLCSFKQDNYIESPSTTELSEEERSIDDNKLIDLILSPSKYTNEQRITFTEASLIRYFQPIYNEKYKFNFPNKNHTSYNECYSSNINSLSFEFDVRDTKVNIYSKATERKKYHKKTYYFYKESDRRLMFGDRKRDNNG